MLVVDASTSMREEKIAHAKLAAKTFIDQMDTTISLAGLVTFASTAETLQHLTSDKERLDRAIDSIAIRSGTNLAAGVSVATESLMNSQDTSQRVMIVLTDGRSNTGGPPQDAAAYAKSQGIRIITIALGDDANQELLRTLASSEEDYYFAPAAADLAAIYSYLVKDTQECIYTVLP